MANQPSGKSPYQRGNSSQRSRGWMLVVTVVILLFATGAWIMSYTRAVETQRPTNTQGIDPGAMGGSTSSTTTK